ncbi:MAG: hypothetical protein ACM3ZT_05280 [Bacillota bacterium]
MNAKYIKPFGTSFAIMSVGSAVLAVVKDHTPALNAAMKALMGHHWITHGVLVMLAFLILGFVLPKSKTELDTAAYNRLSAMVAVTAVISGLILAVNVLFF